MSHERMLRAEKKLKKGINALMRRAQILDAREDQRYGKGKRGSELPDGLRRPQDRMARIRQARELRSKDGQAINALRKTIVEPVNAQFKGARGLRSFQLRGMEKVDPEWHLIPASHNLLKLLQYRRSQLALVRATG